MEVPKKLIIKKKDGVSTEEFERDIINLTKLLNKLGLTVRGRKIEL